MSNVNAATNAVQYLILLPFQSVVGLCYCSMPAECIQELPQTTTMLSNPSIPHVLMVTSQGNWPSETSIAWTRHQECSNAAIGFSRLFRLARP